MTETQNYLIGVRLFLGEKGENCRVELVLRKRLMPIEVPELPKREWVSLNGKRLYITISR